MARRRYLLLACLLAGFGLWPLLAPGYFLKAHDAAHSLFFLVEFDQAFRDGALIPRWGVDHALGYGYPTFVFISPLAYYVAESFHLVGAGITLSVKLTYGLAMLFSAAGTFVLAEGFTSPAWACVAAVLYAFVPYRFVDMYVRSDLAESVAVAIFPWVLWAFWRLARQPSARRVALAAILYGALLLSHNVSAFLFTPLLLAFIPFGLWRSGTWRRWQAWAWCLLAGMLALALASVSLLPALFERAYVSQQQWVQGNYDVSKQFVYPGQLLSPFWGYGYAVAGPDDGMSLQLGLAPLCLALAGFFVGWRDRTRRPLVAFALLGLVAYVLLMLPVSTWVWRALPALAFAQFPWRLLGLAGLCMALLAAGGSAALPRGDPGFPVPVLLALVVVVAALPYAQPEYTAPSARSETPLAIVDFEMAHPDMIGVTAWVKQPPLTSPKLAAYLEGEPLPLGEANVPGAVLQALHRGAQRQSLACDLPQPGELTFYTYYYPGWRAYVDGKEVALHPTGPQGLISFAVPAGRHVASIRFGDTPLRSLAKWITLAAVAVVFLLALGPYHRAHGGQASC